MKELNFLLPAEVEMTEAALYYEARAAQLGERFLAAVELGVEQIQENPRTWPSIGSGIQRYLLPQFPYSLLYRDDPDEIVVIAVMHQKKRPYYWVDRL
ncbi:MAG: type II toxin-antitoxin system RelE/ParE family toxin [Candidatus Electrothrix sp.]|nr:type II toxin-antitoxin system RelE/ParE family toxin [Candidatus Electrothrix sp. AR5]